MGLMNTLDKFLKDRGVKTAYRFWKDTTLPQSTAYRLFKDRSVYPDKKAVEAICEKYSAQPGDFLVYTSAVKSND